MSKWSEGGGEREKGKSVETLGGGEGWSVRVGKRRGVGEKGVA